MSTLSIKAPKEKYNAQLCKNKYILIQAFNITSLQPLILKLNSF